MKTIQPLKQNWKIDVQQGNVREQVGDRVDSEENLTWALGYPLIKSEDITGRLGKINETQFTK